jgi:hypothetical protein
LESAPLREKGWEREMTSRIAIALILAAFGASIVAAAAYPGNRMDSGN